MDYEGYVGACILILLVLMAIGEHRRRRRPEVPRPTPLEFLEQRRAARAARERQS